MVTEFLRPVRVDAFFCSPYLRSLDTIRPAAREHHMEIVTDRRLRERDALPGSNTREMIEKRWADRSFHEEGGESILMVQKRNMQALEELLRDYPGKTLVIGTHGTALSSILLYYYDRFCARDFFEIIDRMPMILKLQFEENRLLHVEQCGYIEKSPIKRQ